LYTGVNGFGMLARFVATISTSVCIIALKL
jgi:hypothetical protein